MDHVGEGGMEIISFLFQRMHSIPTKYPLYDPLFSVVVIKPYRKTFFKFPEFGVRHLFFKLSDFFQIPLNFRFKG